MKILHLNHSDSIGGAAKFAYRLHKSLLSANHDSYMCCSSVNVIDSRIFRVNPEKSSQNNFLRAKWAQTIDSQIRRLEKTNIKSFKSPGWVGAVGSKWINNSDFDVVNLHWINGGLISIKEIGRITKPIVWSMLDMWPFLGAEHYAQESDLYRMKKGYMKSNRPLLDSGVDICRKSDQLKKRYWNENISFVAPSNWLAKIATQSHLLSDVSVSVIPAALDISLFSPRPDLFSDSYSPDTFSIGYGGALSGRKGWELFRKFLNTYNEKLFGSTVIVFGSPITDRFQSEFYNVKQAGRIKDEKELVSLYREMDVLLFPSTLETYGLIAQEAQSCGVPVVCIRNTGTEDVVDDGRSGFVIRGEIEEVIQALLLIKENPEKQKFLAHGARNRAIALWSQDIVAKQYANLYQSRIQE